MIQVVLMQTFQRVANRSCISLEPHKAALVGLSHFQMASSLFKDKLREFCLLFCMGMKLGPSH
jgi:hypothetical protein